MPTAADAGALYDDAYFGGGAGGYADYLADEPLHRANARDRLALIEQQWQRPPGAVVDVGCAHGFFLDEARRAGWRVEGVEIAAGPAAYARDDLGLAVHERVDSLLPARTGAFDVVTLFQVLAHLVDPAAALAQVHALLSPGGLVVIETPNLGSRAARTLGRHWHLATPPSIVSMFDPASLDRLLERGGFAPVQRRVTAKAVSLRFVGSTLRDKYPRLFGPVAALTSRPALARRRVRVALGDVMTVVARRLESGGSGEGTD